MSCVYFLGISEGLMDEFSIDVNDILSDKLMPASLFMIEGPQSRHDNISYFEDITSLIAPGYIGNFQNAYVTMGFHR